MDQVNELFSLSSIRNVWAGVVRSLSDPWSNTLVGPVGSPDEFAEKADQLLKEMVRYIPFRVARARLRDQVSMTSLFYRKPTSPADEWHSLTIWGALGGVNRIEIAVFASDAVQKRYYQKLVANESVPIIHVRGKISSPAALPMSPRRIWDVAYAPLMDKVFSTLLLLSMDETTLSGGVVGVARPMRLFRTPSPMKNSILDIARLLEGGPCEN